MKEKINIANAVTASRIVFAILLFTCTAFSKPYYVFYLLGAVTDMIDGTIARRLNLKSAFGINHGTWQALAIITFPVATFAAIQEGHYIRIGREME